MESLSYSLTTNPHIGKYLKWFVCFVNTVFLFLINDDSKQFLIVVPLSVFWVFWKEAWAQVGIWGCRGWLAQLCVQEDLGLDNENKNKTWHVFEQENIMEENNGVLMNFLERKSMAILANHVASDFCRWNNIFFLKMPGE